VSSSPSLDLKDLFAWTGMQKKKLAVVALISLSLSLLNIIISPPLYDIAAQYLIQKKLSSGLEGDLMKKFSNEKKIEDLGIEPFFYSEKLLKQAIQKSGLQVAVDESTLTAQILKNVTLHSQSLIKVFNINPFQFEVVQFEGLTPVYFTIKAKSKNTFEVASRGIRKQGKMGEELDFQGVKFIVHKFKESDFKLFNLKFVPLETFYLKVKKRLTIARDKKLSSLLQFKFKFKDHASGKHFVNTLIKLAGLEFTGHQKQLLEQETVELVGKKEELDHEVLNLNLMVRPTEWYYQAKLKKQESLKEEILQIHYLKERLSQLIINQRVEPILELKIDPKAIINLEESIADLGPLEPFQERGLIPYLDVESLKKEITCLVPVIENNQKLEDKIIWLTLHLDDLKPYELEEFPLLKALLKEKEELAVFDRKALSTTEQKLIDEKLFDLGFILKAQLNNLLLNTTKEKDFVICKHKTLINELKVKLLSELKCETKKYFSYLGDEIQRLTAKAQLLAQELEKVELSIGELEVQLKENTTIDKKKIESDKTRYKLEEMILLKEIEKSAPFKGGILINEASSLSFPATETLYLLIPIQVILLVIFYLVFKLSKALNLGWLPSLYCLKKQKIKSICLADFSRYSGKKILITDRVKKKSKTELTLSSQFSKKLLLIREKEALQLTKSCIIYLHIDDLEDLNLSAFAFIGFDPNALSLDQVKMLQALYPNCFAIV
jgi:hypothetical protein